MGRRSKARECALQMLYQHEVGDEPLDTVVAAFWRVRTATDAVREMGERLARGAAAARPALDAAIEPTLHHWKLERVGAVERNILRLGVYELLREPTTPVSVVIDEAVELAKRFCEAESSAFVNGVLDAIAQGERRARKDGRA